jgi:hypothetical protein
VFFQASATLSATVFGFWCWGTGFGFCGFLAGLTKILHFEVFK